MKALTIAGRLTKDAETRDVGSDRVTSFSVAVDDRTSKAKSTLFFECSMWGKRGDALQPHLTKGSSVTVSGDFGTREHNDKTYLSVRVNDVTLQGGKKADDGDFRSGGDGRVSGGGGAGGDPEPRGRDNRSPAHCAIDDDLPFLTRAGIG